MVQNLEKNLNAIDNPHKILYARYWKITKTKVNACCLVNTNQNLNFPVVLEIQFFHVRIGYRNIFVGNSR